MDPSPLFTRGRKRVREAVTTACPSYRTLPSDIWIEAIVPYMLLIDVFELAHTCKWSFQAVRNAADAVDDKGEYADKRMFAPCVSHRENTTLLMNIITPKQFVRYYVQRYIYADTAASLDLGFYLGLGLAGRKNRYLVMEQSMYRWKGCFGFEERYRAWLTARPWSTRPDVVGAMHHALSHYMRELQAVLGVKRQLPQRRAPFREWPVLRLEISYEQALKSHPEQFIAPVARYLQESLFNHRLYHPRRLADLQDALTYIWLIQWLGSELLVRMEDTARVGDLNESYIPSKTITYFEDKTLDIYFITCRDNDRSSRTPPQIVGCDKLTAVWDPNEHLPVQPRDLERSLLELVPIFQSDRTRLVRIIRQWNDFVYHANLAQPSFICYDRFLLYRDSNRSKYAQWRDNIPDFDRDMTIPDTESAVANPFTIVESDGCHFFRYETGRIIDDYECTVLRTYCFGGWLDTGTVYTQEGFRLHDRISGDLRRIPWFMSGWRDEFDADTL